MSINPDVNPTSFVRIADALERITMLVEKIANPVITVEAPDPECPFPMGAKVRVKSHPNTVVTVGGWAENWTGRWRVASTNHLLYDPDDLELVPDEPTHDHSGFSSYCPDPKPPFPVGSTVWHVDGRGPWTVATDMDLSDMRAVVNDAGESRGSFYVGHLTATMPEPPVGSVVLDLHGRAWQRDGGGDWYCSGYVLRRGWEIVVTYGPLRVIHKGDSA